MSTVIKWRIYCNTESKWVYGFLDNGIQPSVCFENTAHTINTGSYQKLETISNNNVHIIEETTDTGGHYQAIGYRYDCPVGVSNHDEIYKHSISSLGIGFISDTTNTDDKIEIIVGPESIIGTIASYVSINDTVLTVSSSVLLSAKVGFYITIDDTVNKNDVGLITSIDTINSQITVEIPTSTEFLTGSLVKLSVKPISNFTIGYPGRYVLGETKIGGSYVPANTIIRFKYINNGGVSKVFYPIVELLY